MNYVCATLSTNPNLVNNYYGENIKIDLEKKNLKPFERPMSMFKVLN